jgi:hypothetical protein
VASDPKLPSVGQMIAEGELRSSSAAVEMFLDKLTRHLANTLPDDLCFVLVISRKGENDANFFTSDLETPAAIARLAKTRDQLRQGTLKTAWSKDQEIRASRIIDVS